MKYLVFNILLLLLISCDSGDRKNVEPFHTNFNKLVPETVRYQKGEISLISALNQDGKLEGYCRGYFPNGEIIFSGYFKNGSPCYPIDFLGKIGSLDYKILESTSDSLEMGKQYNIELNHKFIFPYFVDFKVTNAEYLINYPNRWVLTVIPNGKGDCHIKGSVWFRSIKPVEIFNHVFPIKTVAK